MPCRKIAIGEKGYISCSQLGNLYGCGFGTMLTLRNRYVGEPDAMPEPTEEAKRSMEFGTFFEDSVAQFFCMKTGLKVRRYGETAWYRKDMPYFICHPDRIGTGRDSKGRRFALEVKCVSATADGWGEEWTDQIPDRYYLQVQGYSACGVPCDVVYVACMRGNRVYIYEVLPDLEVISDIISKVAKAKADFDNGFIPTSENYKESTRFIGRSVKMDAEGIGANDEVLSEYGRLLSIHRDMKELEKQENEAKTRLMGLLGTAPSFVVTEGKEQKRICWWSEKTNRSLDKELLAKSLPGINLADFQKVTKTRIFNVSYPRGKGETE